MSTLRELLEQHRDEVMQLPRRKDAFMLVKDAIVALEKDSPVVLTDDTVANTQKQLSKENLSMQVFKFADGTDYYRLRDDKTGQTPMLRVLTFKFVKLSP